MASKAINLISCFKTSTGNFRYESQGMQMVHDTWVKYYMPLEGDARWIRTEFGSPTLADVNQLEIHQDTWDSGFTVYYDGVEFERLSPPPLPRSEPSLDVPKQTDEIKQHAAPDYSRY